MLTERDDTAPTEQGRRRFEAALALANRVLANRDEPDQGDQVRRVVDPDARCGTHGASCAGSLLDSSGAADSDLLTALNLLPGHGDAARDTQTRLAAEPRAPGTTVAVGSIDGRGWNGEVLRALSAPQGVGVEVYGPPPAPEETPFSPPRRLSWRPSGAWGCVPGANRRPRRSAGPTAVAGAGPVSADRTGGACQPEGEAAGPRGGAVCAASGGILPARESSQGRRTGQERTLRRDGIVDAATDTREAHLCSFSESFSPESSRPRRLLKHSPFVKGGNRGEIMTNKVPCFRTRGRQDKGRPELQRSH